MKTTKWIWLLCGALTIFSMTGCKADVDLNNIDTNVGLDMSFALPIGNLNLKMSDILGESVLEKIHVGNDHTLFFADTFHISRQYHDVDLAAKVSSATKYCNVHDALGNLEILENNQITGTGLQIPLDFTITMDLKDINTNEYDERIDSAYIENARFISHISTRNLGIKAEWIDKVEIVLSDEFKREDGRTITVYEGSGFQYNKDIEINIDEFALCLMKNRTPERPDDYKNNVVNSLDFHIKFYVTIPYGQVVAIPSNAAFRYDLKVQFIDYKAIWGFFKPSNDMQNEGVIDIFKEWNFWGNFRNAILPFASPIINMYATTQVAGCLVINGHYLYAEESAIGVRKYATFDQAQLQHNFRQEFYPGTPSAYTKYDFGYLPLSSAIGDSARMYILFNKDWDKGHIDNLFTIRPDVLGYKFDVRFDQDSTPQIRITDNTSMRIDAELIAPFTFNKGVKVEYKDSITNINLSEIAIDSILSSSVGFDTVMDSEVALVLDIENRIPLHLKGVFRFYDANGQLIMDPDDPTQPLRFSSTDTLSFEVPTIEYSQGVSHISEPGHSTFALYINHSHSKLLASIKAISLTTSMDADELNYAFEKDPNFHVAITDQDQLKLNIGIATNIKAAYKF